MTKPSAIAEQAHLWVKDITEKVNITGSYLAKKKKEGTTKNGKSFLSLTLADRTGDIEARVWNRANEFSALFDQGDVIEVKGVTESYQGQVQINVSWLGSVSGKDMDPDIFLETAPDDISEMFKSLRGILRDLNNAHLKALVDSFLSDRQFVSSFKTAPAAKGFHHCYRGGLLEHTLSLCRMAIQAATQYPQLDRDLLLVSAFLHDLGKIRELKQDLTIDYTDEGRLIGHLVLGSAMVDERLGKLKNFPQDLAVRLKHLILSHHGQYEFGSPKRPKFLEAFALNLLDDLDAKLNGVGRFMERDQRKGAWTAFNRMFEQYFLKGKIRSVEKKSDDNGGTDERRGLRQGTLFSN